MEEDRVNQLAQQLQVLQIQEEVRGARMDQQPPQQFPELPAPLSAGEYRVCLRSLPLFDEHTSRTSFLDHLELIDQWRYGNGVIEDSQSKLGLLHSLRGASHTRASHIGLNTRTWINCPSYAAYLAEMKLIFLPRSEQMLSRAEFRARRQHPQEDIISYFSSKYALFTEAYGDNRDYLNFLEAFISGLYSQLVKRLVRRANPQTYEDLKTKVSDIVAAERSSYLDGYGESDSLDGLAASSKASRHTGFDPPMEVGTVSAFDNRRSKPEANKVAARACHVCGKIGHLKKDCPRNKMVRDRKPEPQKKSCNRCGRTNHFYKDCVAKTNTRGQPIVDKMGKAKKINQIEHEDDVDVEETELLELLTHSVNCMSVKPQEGFHRRRAPCTGACPPRGRRRF